MANRTLAALEADDKIVCADLYSLLDEADISAAKADSSLPLERVNRAKPAALLLNRNLLFHLRLALLSFLKGYKRSKWRQRQEHYIQRIGISLVACWEYGKAIALCGVHGWLCQQADYCPKCALIQRYKPARWEFGNVYTPDLHFYALSPSFEVNPNRAGLKFVVVKGNKKRGLKEVKKRFNPYQGKKEARPLTVKHYTRHKAEVDPVTACFKAIFKLAEKLVKTGAAQGVLAQREIAWHFQPHSITPNGHFLVVTKQPMTFEMAKEILFLFERIYTCQPSGKHLYPDVHVEELMDQPEINRWLAYMFKPMDYVTGYLRAVKAGVDIVWLNDEIDKRVFQGGAEILRAAKSPLRYGILRCNMPGYIGAGSITKWREEQKAKRQQRKSKQNKEEGKPEKEQPDRRGQARTSTAKKALGAVVLEHTEKS